jgi:ElaB/YqjD/DUF883 family membrane-anchored ribosome-binding protein
MVFASEAAATIEALGERFRPAAESAEQTMRAARRAVACGRRAAEDASLATSLFIRRRPFTAVALAAGAGIVLGAAAGILVARCRR